MLDDRNVIAQRDPQDALGIAAKEIDQLTASIGIENPIQEKFSPNNVIVAAMGGSALAGDIAKTWLHLPAPVEVVRQYELPAYANDQTLVIAISHSGNTEETLSAVEQAKLRGCQIAVLASGGKLVETARANNYPIALLPKDLESRMAILNNLRALTKLLEMYGLVRGACDEMAANADWLAGEVAQWLPDVSTADNYAKQLATTIVGKTAVLYGGPLMSPIAYKWKIALNENAKNLAFCGQLPEFNHNEFIGWTSHPVEKPFAVIDLVSNFEHDRVRRRFEVSDTLLSGKRPKSTTIQLKGDNTIAQMMWASILGDFVSLYLAILNGVNPSSLDLVDKLKQKLSE